MNLRKLLLTKNACYKAGKSMTPKGIMVHSTGANNPNLKRYVGPDDGFLGVNQYNNHWNTFNPGGRQICVHAFIGKLKDGTIATYQTLPWDMVGWHSGSGSNGNANYMGYIGFEICEDGLNDPEYFSAVYKEAVELCVYLCKQYGLTETNIICHSEGYKLGIASNHSDVMHWLPKYGKSMDTFRADVKAGLGANETVKPSEPTVSTDTDLAVVGTTTPTPITYRVHTVVHGDTLWAIAKKYLGNGRRYKEIVMLNNLKSNVIYSGMKLNIPN